MSLRADITVLKGQVLKGEIIEAEVYASLL